MINYCVFECMTVYIIDFGNTSKTYYSCLFFLDMSPDMQGGCHVSVQ